ncbi:MAG TPA: YkgJ family cysteine cluster protein [Nitrospiraceae bacterium]|nr:YkgJ family cysteine cluster protein [Nitrospiraceae bacterium]
MNARSERARHARLPADADHWFTRAKATLLGQLPCRRGCSRCCMGPFAITILDVAGLQQGMASLDQTVRDDIQARALSQLTIFEASFPRLAESPFLDSWNDQELDSLVAQFADLPCPALDADGSCRVYPFRPVTCRTMGIPVEADGRVE